MAEIYIAILVVYQWLDTYIIFFISLYRFNQSKIPIHNIPSNWPINVAETKKKYFDWQDCRKKPELYIVLDFFARQCNMLFWPNRNGLDRSRKMRSELRKKSSHSWTNCHKPVGLLINKISHVPNKFHKPLASDLWLNSQTVYMMLVTKYQISAINSYWEKCDDKYLGRTEGQTDRGKTVYPPPPSGSGGIIKHTG